LEAIGKSELEEVLISKIDENFCPVPGTEQVIKADMLCLAVGLTPRIELAALADCGLYYSPVLGGCLPLHGPDMRSTQHDFYVAGDLAGVEEASTALDEGQLAGLAAAEALGKAGKGSLSREKADAVKRLTSLRQGPFGEKRQRAKEDIISRCNG